MRVGILTNEYPPHVYGGAGVHVDHLVRELSHLCEVDVICFGNQHEDDGLRTVRGIPALPLDLHGDPRIHKALTPFARNLGMVSRWRDWDVVHGHTWYSHLGCLLVREAYGTPIVLTTHSLEPSRPWKAEQLGEAGYRLSCWVEGTAYRAAAAAIAVSKGMSTDLVSAYGVDPSKIRVVPNGVDPTVFVPDRPRDWLAAQGIDLDRPYVLFVGRIARQKGIAHFLEACRHLDPSAQVVLAASSPDTPELGREVEQAVARLLTSRTGVVWMREPVPLSHLPDLYAGAAVYCCPSIYEPFGITNLEAMACATPVVGARIGGIPEVVMNEETGFLVDLGAQSPRDFEPLDPQKYALRLAAAINRILAEPECARAMGKAGRLRVMNQFSWAAVARRILAIYEDVSRVVV